METRSKKFKTVSEYFASLPQPVKTRMQQIRTAIKKVAPQAEEVISYNMPAFKLEGMLVWYMAHTKHIGFYPRTTAIEVFKEELSAYKSAKGSVQFPLDKPLPLALITKMVKFRVEENLSKLIRKGSKKVKMESRELKVKSKKLKARGRKFKV